MSIGIVFLAPALLAARPVMPHSVAVQQISDTYARLNAATDSKNLAGLLSCFTPKYTFTSPAGRTFSLAVERKDMAAAFKQHRTITSQTHVQSMHVLAASGTVDLQVTDTFTGILSKTKQPYVYVVTEHQEDDWVRTPQGWRIKHTQIWAEQRRFNGKVISG